MLETNIDDMSGELYTDLMAELFKAKAKDVFFESIYMKKNRPATKVSVLVGVDQCHEIEKLLFIHSTTFGIRKYSVSRTILERTFKAYDTPLGKITFKFGYYESELLKVTPEYESLKALSLKIHKPVSDLYVYAMGFIEKEILGNRL